MTTEKATPQEMTIGAEKAEEEKKDINTPNGKTPGGPKEEEEKKGGNTPNEKTPGGTPSPSASPSPKKKKKSEIEPSQTVPFCLSFLARLGSSCGRCYL